LGITPDHCICTGDVVAYCADAVACVDEIRDWGVHVVMGNCEESLGFGNDDCGCGFEEGTACDLLSKQWYDYAAGVLNEGHRAWMRGLKRSIDFTFGPFKLRVLHGGVEEINRFVFASQSDVIKEELSRIDADIVLGGHCGLPFVSKVGGQLWHNAGVIGMPANDGTAKTWYSLLNRTGHDVEITFHALDYDHQKASEKMRQNNLAEGYANALETGLWPSLDVLPETERQMTGLPLGMHSFRYSKS
jgi:predicted phosphodiesterase